MLRLLITGLFLAPVLLLTTPLVIVYSGLQNRALVPVTPAAQQDDIERLKSLLYQHDPRTLRDGEIRTLAVSERDINIALRSLIPLAERQRARVSLRDGLATLDYTFEVPANPVGSYFNLSLAVREGGELSPVWLRAGELEVPGWMLVPVICLAESLVSLRVREYRGAREALQAATFDRGEAEITYRWNKALMKQIEQRGREVFLPPADRERALAYYRELSTLSRSVGRSASLSRLLNNLFEQAVQRSGEGDAAAENRVLLLVVGTVLNRSSMHRLVGGDPADLQPGHYYVRWMLSERNDLAQHFGISAAIAAAGGSVLADAMGAYKELDDSRGGSGFSFPDLLADRAGVEFAVAAIGAEAGIVQRVMAGKGVKESDFMPTVVDLPEGLMEMEFRQRYSDLDDVRYGHIKREIDSRIARLPLYRRR